MNSDGFQNREPRTASKGTPDMFSLSILVRTRVEMSEDGGRIVLIVQLPGLWSLFSITLTLTSNDERKIK